MVGVEAIKQTVFEIRPNEWQEYSEELVDHLEYGDDALGNLGVLLGLICNTRVREEVFRINQTMLDELFDDTENNTSLRILHMLVNGETDDLEAILDELEVEQTY